MTAVRAAADARVEALLTTHAEALGRDGVAYGGHVRRLVALVRAQRPGLSADEEAQLAIAAVFHDLGIWLDGTFDYLEPSLGHAVDHLRAEGLEAWEPRVGRMILLHHKVRPIPDDPLVDAFRRADLCDLSFGWAASGIRRATWTVLAAEHPTAGFQRRIVQLSLKRTLTHPLSPLPMLRW